MPNPRKAAARFRLPIAVAGAAGLVALTVPAGPAAADVIADKSRTLPTASGWSLSVSKVGETLDRYPNLAATPFTREGFVSLRADAAVTGEGSDRIDWGALDIGYQIGCQVDVSNGLTLGLGLSIGPYAGLTVSGPEIGGAASVNPNVSTTLKPGTINTVKFAGKALNGRQGSITADQVQIKVDGCMGQVSLRSYATATLSTETADSSTTVYGDPIWL
ncbi:MspA family porin [Nocardia yamanashiensis]|uniref:MspA family porin n=1 Tax=Nocardia yamanashiensis TaxID=209247 RepID=UPI00082B2556|nr:MspA family porin [Nocardia yamanashiensis]